MEANPEIALTGEQIRASVASSRSEFRLGINE
jgi:hypothetical protein